MDDIQQQVNEEEIATFMLEFCKICQVYLPFLP